MEGEMSIAVNDFDGMMVKRFDFAAAGQHKPGRLCLKPVQFLLK